MMKKTVLIWLIVLSLCACKGNSSRISDTSRIPVVDSGFVSIALSQENKVSTSDIVAETEVIRLDSKKGLIGRIKRTIVTDNNIVISDDNSVFVFDREGKGIARINRLGRGPQDYVQLTHITLTPDNDIIAIYDSYGSKVLYFSLDGKFLSSTRGKFWFSAMEFSILNEIVCITYGAGKQDPGLKNYRDNKDLVYFLNDKLEIEESCMPLGHDKDKFKYSSPLLHKFGEKVYVNPLFGDTIYVARNNVLQAKYHIDMKAIGGEANFADKITDAEFDALTKRSATFNGDFIDSEDHLFLFVGTPPERRVANYLYSKKSGKNYLIEPKSLKLGGSFLNNMLLGARTSYSDKFVSVVDAYAFTTMLEEVRNAIPELSGIREEDNPVVVLYTLNENL